MANKCGLMSDATVVYFCVKIQHSCFSFVLHLHSARRDITVADDMRHIYILTLASNLRTFMTNFKILCFELMIKMQRTLAQAAD